MGFSIELQGVITESRPRRFAPSPKWTLELGQSPFSKQDEG